LWNNIHIIEEGNTEQSKKSEKECTQLSQYSRNKKNEIKLPTALPGMPNYDEEIFAQQLIAALSIWKNRLQASLRDSVVYQ